MLGRVEEHVVVVVHVDRDYDGRHVLHKEALVLQLHLDIVLAVKRRRPCRVLEDSNPVLELRCEVRFLGFDLFEAAVKELDLAQVELEVFILSLLGRNNSLLLQFHKYSLLVVSLATWRNCNDVSDQVGLDALDALVALSIIDCDLNMNYLRWLVGVSVELHADFGLSALPKERRNRVLFGEVNLVCDLLWR